MTPLIILLAGLLIAIVVGKILREVRPAGYFIVVIITLIQLCLVMYEMFTMAEPQ